jgi:transcriptional regulator with XRE-family HTH domain
VIDMELLSVIRRWRLRDHFSIREISRRTGLSRNTVRKYLRSDIVEPKFNLADRTSKLDPYADKLSEDRRRSFSESPFLDHCPADRPRQTKQSRSEMPNRIENYLVIGNCERLALMGRDGSIDRLGLQRFDSAARFCTLLSAPTHAGLRRSALAAFWVAG